MKSKRPALSRGLRHGTGREQLPTNILRYMIFLSFVFVCFRCTANCRVLTRPPTGGGAIVASSMCAMTKKAGHRHGLGFSCDSNVPMRSCYSGTCGTSPKDLEH